MVGKANTSGQNPFILRIEGQLRQTNLNKGFPLVLTPPVPKTIPLIEPLQEIANRVASCQQGIEVVSVQTFALEQRSIFVKKSVQRQLHGVSGIVILSDIQTKPALIRFQIRSNCPVFCIDL